MFGERTLKVEIAPNAKVLRSVSFGKQQGGQ